MKEDIADEMAGVALAAIKTLGTVLSAEHQVAVAFAIRDHFGSETHWIPRKKNTDAKLEARNARIRNDYQRGESFKLMERRYELCERQLRRILKLDLAPA